MNRLSPLIVRKAGLLRLPASGRRSGQGFAPAIAYPAPSAFEALPVAQWLDDLKLFATGWAAGLIVFGTFFG